MVNDRPVVEWSTDTDNQAFGWAYGGAGTGGSLIIGQLGIWSAGGCLIIVLCVVQVIYILYHDPCHVGDATVMLKRMWMCCVLRQIKIILVTGRI